MKNKNAIVITKEDLIQNIKSDYLRSIRNNIKGNVLITAGAGDIDQLVQPIKEILLNNIL
jgi:hypothetical protein